jgi:hypothetical protein
MYQLHELKGDQISNLVYTQLFHIGDQTDVCTMTRPRLLVVIDFERGSRRVKSPAMDRKFIDTYEVSSVKTKFVEPRFQQNRVHLIHLDTATRTTNRHIFNTEFYAWVNSENDKTCR